MAPYVPEEVDVFSVPHSRMKELVNDYILKIETTDFNDDTDTEVFLETLYKTFVEFKNHERIENNLIIKKLKYKLKGLSIKNHLVCNCHRDSHTTDMLLMVKEGYNKKTGQDRHNFGLKLKEALEGFTQNFLPHMKLEEEIFQPLLQKYFSYEELCALKKRVIQYHLDQCNVEKGVKDDAIKDTYPQSSDSEDDLCDGVTSHVEVAQEVPRKTCITDLPEEVLLTVFSYLSPQDLCRAAQTCHQWNVRAYDPGLWREIHPVKWAQGDWSFRYHRQPRDEDEDCEVEANENDEYVIVDEDADIDESEDSDHFENEALRQIKREAEILVGLNKYLLSKVGEGVQVLNLSNSRAITNGLVHKMLRQCPKIEYLDLSQTRISDAGLKSMGKNNCCSNLKTLVLSGCGHMTDTTLMRLAMAQSRPAVTQHRHHQMAVPKDKNHHAIDADEKDAICTTKDNYILEQEYEVEACLCASYFQAKEDLDSCKNNCTNETLATEQAACKPRTESMLDAKPSCDKDSCKSVSGQGTMPHGTVPEAPDASPRVIDGAYYDRTFDKVAAVALPDQESQTHVWEMDVDGCTTTGACPSACADAGRCTSVDGCSSAHADAGRCTGVGGCPSTCADVSGCTSVDGCPSACADAGRCTGLDDCPSAYADAVGYTSVGGCSSAHADAGRCTGVGGCPSAHADAGRCTDLDDCPSACADASAGTGDPHHQQYKCCKMKQSGREPIACHTGCEAIKAKKGNDSIVIEDCAKPKLLKAPPVPPGGRRDSGGSVSMDRFHDDFLTRPPAERSLQYLNLSGCYQVTDIGIQALSGCGPFPRLQHLDVSGCPYISGDSLAELVAECPTLDPERLYYCDNIIDGPFPESASGCRNLQCGARYCCRAGK